MEGQAKKTAQEITNEFIREFAELNLELTKHLRKFPEGNASPELLRELRENAQVLRNLV